MNRHEKRAEAVSLKVQVRAEKRYAAETVKQYPVDLGSSRLAHSVARVAAKVKRDGDSINTYYPAVAELVIAECIRIAPSSPASDAFFERPAPGAIVHWQYLSRILAIGDTLFALRDSEGFDIFCTRLRQQKIRATFFEAFAARMFTDLDFRITFRAETGAKGQDFDFVATRGDVTVNVEATTLSGPQYSSDTVRNAIEQKRRQLSRDAPGVVFVVVPEEWFVGRHDEVMQLLRGDVNDAFRQTERINAVVFLNEVHEDFGLPDRGHLGYMFDACLHREPRYPLIELIAFIDGTLHRPEASPEEARLAALQTVHQDSPFFRWAATFWNVDQPAA